jgi:acid phosphatase
MQIDGGKNDKFAAYGDAGGLVMGHYDGQQLAIFRLASQYTLLDNFYQGAFGGSFLNHQYLICACAPEYPNADQSPAKGSITQLDRDASGHFTANLTIAGSSPASALSGPPVFVNSGSITPKDYFHDGTFRAINTMQPPYQPSGNAPAAGDQSRLYADPSVATTLPPQTQLTIGDLLNQAHIDWAWYSGAWKSTVQAATTSHQFPPARLPGAAPNFQFHHQPFNFYADFDPATHAVERARHLKDYDDLVQAAQNGRLPPVVFYKPEGDLNEHPGYASLSAGDAHLAHLIEVLKASPQWSNMVIVITYDENGGAWDHQAPPVADLLGPGTRIPAVVISPFAKMGTVDHTPYDTGSVLRLITRRFSLPQLSGLAARDAALKAHGQPAMGDLTQALAFQ